MRRIRKSKKRIRQKQRQKQHVVINVTAGGSGGGRPIYIPTQPSVGEANLPNQYSLVPNRGYNAIVSEPHLLGRITAPAEEASSIALTSPSPSRIVGEPAYLPATAGEPKTPVGGGASASRIPKPSGRLPRPESSPPASRTRIASTRSG